MSIAFFDVDGTLLPHPSLERRFFGELLRHGRIPPANYLRWAAQMVRLTTTNFAAAAQSNKVYLRGVPDNVLSQPELRQSRWMPELFPDAVQRVWFHASRGDEIVLVTGTLAPLAEIVKAALERELVCRGVEAQIAVIATRLAMQKGRWTGRVHGVPMFGDAKRVAARDFASSRSVSLSQCYAYGDQAVDRAMLESVGNPVAINPSPHLHRIALHSRWLVLRWPPCPPRTDNARHPFKWKGKVAR